MYRLLQIFFGVAGFAGVALWGGGVAWAAEPSFDCGRVKKGSIENLVCSDEELASLDRSLNLVYIQAVAQVGEEQAAGLKVEELGWIRGRDDCWKSSDRRTCVREQYVQRIAELQARYQMVPTTGPVTFRCDDPARSVVYVTYFATEPPTLIAELGDQTSLMYLQPSGSGARYTGGNESFWEHQGEAMITWGADSPTMNCTTKAASTNP